MKIFKRLICASISLLMMISLINPLSVNAVETNTDVNTYIGELIAYYRDYQDNAKTDILRILDKIKELDKTKYDAWQEIMNFWSGVNKEGYTNVGVLPDGLPQDDSLCIVILGFALNSDGTMKQELINRLQISKFICSCYRWWNCFRQSKCNRRRTNGAVAVRTRAF